jgi:TolB-like protein
MTIRVNMDRFDHGAISRHVDRICESDAFQASPKLCQVLRYLVEKTLSGEGTSLGQYAVADDVLGLGGQAASSRGAAARMQIGRLRKQLEAFYGSVGRDEPIRIEIPKRNFRLRFRPAAGGLEETPRARERTILGVIQLADLGIGNDHAWLPQTLTSELLMAFGAFSEIAITGPMKTMPAAGVDRGIDFFLTGGVRAQGSTAQLSLQLVSSQTGLQLWTRVVSFELTGDQTLPTGSWKLLVRIADELADETGVLACEEMRQTATKPAAELSVRETRLASWRFVLTGMPEDLTRARESAAAVVEAVPDCPTAMICLAMMELAAYLGDPRPSVRCPRVPLELLERAHSISPGDPWVSVHRGFALWMAKEPVGLEAICRGLDGRPSSGSFCGMLGSLMAVSGIDLARGEALLLEALARAPQPLYWYCHHAALCGFLRGDLDAMQRALDRIAVRVDPFSLVLRMVLASERGNRREACGLATMILEVMPEFAGCGEVMLRRLLHDDHVDRIATAVRPLGLGWFEAQPATA